MLHLLQLALSPPSPRSSSSAPWRKLKCLGPSSTENARPDRHNLASMLARSEPTREHTSTIGDTPRSEAPHSEATAFWQVVVCTPQCEDNHCVDRQSFQPEDVEHKEEGAAMPKLNFDYDAPFLTDMDEVYDMGKRVKLLDWPDATSPRAELPWASLDGPPEEGVKGRFAAMRPAPKRIPRQAAPSRMGRTPEPKINPITGFMTLVTSACDYSAELTDPMDVEFVRQLRRLNPDAAVALMIRRLAPGIYEIDGRRVNLSWSGGAVLASEEGKDQQVPVYVYLQEAGAVAVQLHKPRRTLTFPTQGANIYRASDDDRYQAMINACSQAKARENAAQAIIH